MNAYDVEIERDESGAWIARVPAIRGCHSYGRTLDQARNRIREALSLWIDDAERAELSFEIRLPRDVRTKVSRFHRTRSDTEKYQRDLQRSLADAAVALTEDAGVSLRDAADILNLSHQRVAQVINATGDMPATLVRPRGAERPSKILERLRRDER